MADLSTKAACLSLECDGLEYEEPACFLAYPGHKLVDSVDGQGLGHQRAEHGIQLKPLGHLAGQQ